MKYVLKLIAISFLLLSGLHAADVDACPASIDVKPQQIAKEVPGWTVGQQTGGYADHHSHVLWSVMLYDGDPKDLASLIPDINDNLRRVWTLAYPTSTIWVECHYTRTTIVLRRPLPKTTKSCALTFERSAILDGENVIQKMTCR